MIVEVLLFCRDENQYLEEWIEYHKSIGIDKFTIGDNNSKIPITDTIKELGIANVEVIRWEGDEIGGQMRFYEYCCKKSTSDYCLIIDTDEFCMLSKEYGNIKELIERLTNSYGKFDGLGISWRFYGKTEPYFENRQSMEDYTQYHQNRHLKSLINPKALSFMGDPHKGILKQGSFKYIDENGKYVTNPVHNYHNSKYIWIKHIYTRSLNEWKEKIVRGRGDKVPTKKTIEEFYGYNDQCIIND